MDDQPAVEAEAQEAEEWCTIKRAAAILEMKERTAYAKASGLPRRKGPNGAMIRLADLRARITDRRATTAIVPQRGAIAAIAAARSSGSGGGSGNSHSLDGALEAAMLRRFEQGAGPVEVAMELQTPLPRARALYGEYRRAKQENASGTSVEEQLKGIAEFLTELEQRVLKHDALLLSNQCPNCGYLGTPVLGCHNPECKLLWSPKSTH